MGRGAHGSCQGHDQSHEWHCPTGRCYCTSLFDVIMFQVVVFLMTWYTAKQSRVFSGHDDMTSKTKESWGFQPSNISSTVFGGEDFWDTSGSILDFGMVYPWKIHVVFFTLNGLYSCYGDLSIRPVYATGRIVHRPHWILLNFSNVVDIIVYCMTCQKKDYGKCM